MFPFCMSRMACLLIGAVFFLGLTACQTRDQNSSARSLVKGNNDIILAQCASPQGNGGNWGATLGWIAEDWMVLAEKAEIIENETGQNVYVYMRCFSGGSSGSGATLTVMNLLKNEKVLSRYNSNPVQGSQRQEEDELVRNGFFRAQDVRDYARAMRMLALAADMSAGETAKFFVSVAIEQAKAFAQLDGENKELTASLKNRVNNMRKAGARELRARVSQPDAYWWDGGPASAEVSVVDFVKVAHAALHINHQMVNTPIDQVIDVVLAHPSFNNIFNSFNEWQISRIEKSSAEQGDKKTLSRRLTEFAKKQGISTAVDFSLAKEVAGLNCSTDESCTIVGAAKKIDQLEESDNSPAANYARLFLIEHLQSYYSDIQVQQAARLTRSGKELPAFSGNVFNATKTFNDEMKSVESVLRGMRESGNWRSTDDGPVPFPKEASEKLKYSVFETLADRLDEGYFTIVTAAFAKETRERLKQKELKFYRNVPQYDELQFVTLMDESTRQAMMASRLYKTQTQGCAGKKWSAGSPQDKSDFPCRFVLGATDSAAYAILPSVREPDLMNEFYRVAFDPSKYGSQHFGVRTLWDPRNESQELISYDRPGSTLGTQTYVAVGGGWPDRRLSNWMMAYYLDTLLSNHPRHGLVSRFTKIRSGGNPVVTASMSIFGKPDATSDVDKGPANVNQDEQLKQKFDVNAVGAIFSTKDKADRNRADYMSFMTAYYDFFRSEGGHIGGSENTTSGSPNSQTNQNWGVPVLLKESLVHWDLREVEGALSIASSLPSFLQIGSHGGASRFLVKLSHNGVREGLINMQQRDTGGTGVSMKQFCSLARWEYPTEQVGGFLGFGGRTVSAGPPTVRRLQCSRMMAHETSLFLQSNLAKGMPSYRKILDKLAQKSRVTFNVVDLRIAQGRTDAGNALAREALHALETDQKPQPPSK